MPDVVFILSQIKGRRVRIMRVAKQIVSVVVSPGKLCVVIVLREERRLSLNIVSFWIEDPHSFELLSLQRETVVSIVSEVWVVLDVLVESREWVLKVIVRQPSIVDLVKADGD